MSKHISRVANLVCVPTYVRALTLIGALALAMPGVAAAGEPDDPPAEAPERQQPQSKPDPAPGIESDIPVLDNRAMYAGVSACIDPRDA
ncbi:MAG: hypothetical protein QNJ00_11350 [Woeseiaceae bacterium]|nr:hypothetical protein [Woeseiaceae bacterium]